MKFEVEFPRDNFVLLMRRCGYAPDGTDERTGELRFVRGSGYPRFHMYCFVQEKERKALCNLHLDQKKPSYRGVFAHSGEYEGEIVQEEVKRLLAKIQMEMRE